MLNVPKPIVFADEFFKREYTVLADEDLLPFQFRTAGPKYSPVEFTN
jgi:hypothetical protein